MRWSQLQHRIYDVWVDRLDGQRLQIHCTAYGLGGSASVGRWWITLGREIVWDVPRDFPEERAKGTYNPVASEIADLVEDYLNTPRGQLLTREFPTDRWSLVEIFRAADRRLGRARLAELHESLASPVARRILEARLASPAG